MTKWRDMGLHVPIMTKMLADPSVETIVLKKGASMGTTIICDNSVFAYAPKPTDAFGPSKMYPLVIYQKTLKCTTPENVRTLEVYFNDYMIYLFEALAKRGSLVDIIDGESPSGDCCNFEISGIAKTFWEWVEDRS